MRWLLKAITFIFDEQRYHDHDHDDDDGNDNDDSNDIIVNIYWVLKMYSKHMAL